MSIMKTTIAAGAALASVATGQAQEADNDFIQIQGAFANAVVEHNFDENAYRFPNPNLGVKAKVGEKCTGFAAIKFHADRDLNYQDTSLLAANLTCDIAKGWQAFGGLELPGKQTEDSRSVKNGMPLLEADREREILPFLYSVGLKNSTSAYGGNFETFLQVGTRTGFLTGPLPDGAPGRNSDALSFVASTLWQDDDTRLGIRHMNLAENDKSGLSSEVTQVFAEQRFGRFLAAGEYNFKDNTEDTYTLTGTYDITDQWDMTAFGTSERYGLETRYVMEKSSNKGKVRAGFGAGVSCLNDNNDCGPAASFQLGFIPALKQ